MPGPTSACRGGPARQAEVPQAVAAAIASELESLSAQSRAFLDAAAVAGEPFEPDLAAAIAELSDDQGLAALDDLLALDLVRPTEVPRRFGFRHPLVRRSRVRVDARGLAAGGPRARRARRSPPGAPTPPSGPTTSSSPQRQGDQAGDRGAARGRARSPPPAAPAAAARWYEAALRLLPGGDAERQVEVRVALASALRSLGELERCRTTLLDAAERLGPEAAMRRVELTAQCASVEHWQGRHEDAHRRLVRAWEDLPDRGTPEAAALQVELTVDGLYGNDFDQTFEMGDGALETARPLGDRGLTAAAASVLALGEAAAAGPRPRASTAPRHWSRSSAWTTRSWRTGSRRSTTSAGPRTTWSTTTTRLGTPSAASRSPGRWGTGRLLVPLMLMRCYPFEMQGRLAEAIELCETAVEIARVSANPHYLFWALLGAGLGPLLRRRPRRNDRRGRGERSRGRAHARRAPCRRPAAAPAGRSRWPPSSSARWIRRAG